MKATSMLFALALTFGLAGAARAQDACATTTTTETVYNGVRWRWIPGDTVVEDRSVTVPGHYETRTECVTEPGHYETRERQVWHEGTVRYERRERTIPGTFVHDRGSATPRWIGPRVVSETVPVRSGGCWETVCERVWVPGCTHEVERQIWIPPHAETRQVTCQRPGHWERFDDSGFQLRIGGKHSDFQLEIH
jgi:hypothetical protein